MRILLSLCFTALICTISAAPPNIVFMLTDDLGFNAPGYRNPDLITPTLDSLAADGLKLDFHYTYKYCAPTRGSFLTGRLPYHLSATRTNLIPWDLPDGIDLSYTMLPKKLKKAGYTSHHIGKWHQGFYTVDYTPMGRGFDSTFGFLEGGEDHFTQETFRADGLCQALDLWENNAPAYGKNGTYNGYAFTKHAVDLIKNHDKNSGPMFLYFALHNTHGPVEAPERFTNMYHFDQKLRNVFNGMISVVDESAKNVTQALKESGMWENTLFIWTTDNGTPVQVAGSNKPLRGSKGTNFEGGTRVPGFVNGGILPAKMRAKHVNGTIHIADWYATFCELAGIDPADPGTPTPVESLSMWKYLSGQSDESPRKKFVYDHRMFTSPYTGAIRGGDYKLIVGPEVAASWFGQFSPNTTYNKDMYKVTACSVDKPCLFNIANDPTEHFDLAEQMPEKVSEMMKEFKALEKEYHPPKSNPPRDTKGYCGAVSEYHDFVHPWQKGKQT